MTEFEEFVQMILEEGVKNRDPIALASYTHKYAVQVMKMLTHYWGETKQYTLPNSETMRLLEAAYDKLRFATEYLETATIPAEDRVATALWSLQHARFTLARALRSSNDGTRQLVFELESFIRKLESQS